MSTNERTARLERYLSLSSSNALEDYTTLKDLFAGCHIIVFLDYDGTLTPIVSDPDNALLSESMKDVVNELRKYFVTGVISGRSLSKVKSFVGLDGLFYAGSHGFDIVGPNGTSIRHQVASEYLPKLASIREHLKQRLCDIDGIYIEDNVFSVSVHYRNIDPALIAQVKDVVMESIAEHPEIRIGNGKKVYELKPNIQWNKGEALTWLLQALGLYGDEKVFTVYIGDDITDEDAFRVLSANQKCKGVGIMVADNSVETNASFTLRDPQEVARFLQKLIQFGKDIGAKADHTVVGGQ